MRSGILTLLGGALGLLPLQDARGGPALVGVGVLDDPVGRAPFVVLGQVLGDGQPVRRHEEQAVAVFPLLHLVAGADPAAQLGLRLGIGVEVARAEGPPDQLDVAREALHHGLGHAHVRVQGGAGLLRVLARVVPHLVDIGLRGLDRLQLAHAWAFASASSIFAGLNPASRVSPMMITGSDMMPIAISSLRASGSFPTFFSTNGTPFCDRYSVAR